MGLESEKQLSPLLANPVNREYRLSDMLKRPEIRIEHLMPILDSNLAFSDRVQEQVVTYLNQVQCYLYSRDVIVRSTELQIF